MLVYLLIIALAISGVQCIFSDRPFKDFFATSKAFEFAKWILVFMVIAQVYVSGYTWYLAN